MRGYHQITTRVPEALWIRLKSVSERRNQSITTLVEPAIVPAITQLLDELEADDVASTDEPVS